MRLLAHSVPYSRYIMFLITMFLFLWTHRNILAQLLRSGDNELFYPHFAEIGSTSKMRESELEKSTKCF